MVNPIVEVCANSVQSCIEAQNGGAYRVELCAGIPEGGTTPSYGEIVTARESISILLNVIIRPRGGDFLYSQVEIKSMLRDIEVAKKCGADGVVFGCLSKNGEIDIIKNRVLLEAAKGMSVTFHRAFDVCVNPFVALETIIDLGFDTILTSGQKANAIAGKECIKKMVEQAGQRIIIMPGCGVNEENVADLARFTGAKEFHMSARKRFDSAMEYRNCDVSMGGTVIIDEFKNDITVAERVEKSIEKLKNV